LALVRGSSLYLRGSPVLADTLLASATAPVGWAQPRHRDNNEDMKQKIKEYLMVLFPYLEEVKEIQN
jgi:hypothetical protein